MIRCKRSKVELHLQHLTYLTTKFAVQRDELRSTCEVLRSEVDARELVTFTSSIHSVSLTFTCQDTLTQMQTHLETLPFHLSESRSQTLTKLKPHGRPRNEHKLEKRRKNCPPRHHRTSTHGVPPLHPLSPSLPPSPPSPSPRLPPRRPPALDRLIRGSRRSSHSGRRREGGKLDRRRIGGGGGGGGGDAVRLRARSPRPFEVGDDSERDDAEDRDDDECGEGR